MLWYLDYNVRLGVRNMIFNTKKKFEMYQVQKKKRKREREILLNINIKFSNRVYLDTIYFITDIVL